MYQQEYYKPQVFTVIFMVYVSIAKLRENPIKPQGTPQISSLFIT